mmetsp:Transcript_25731/g.61803  ORF Transcript_25731/g.61803 Transcript_25731/m.61803 type:complete len:84 (-) Transcript_25731:715-966(-)
MLWARLDMNSGSKLGLGASEGACVEDGSDDANPCPEMNDVSSGFEAITVEGAELEVGFCEGDRVEVGVVYVVELRRKLNVVVS